MVWKFLKLACRKPRQLLGAIFEKVGRYVSDEKYIKTKFRILLGYKLDIRNPKTFNEKLNWLKLHDRKELYTLLADKYLVKSYVRDKIGEEYVIPLLGVWNSIDEVDIDELPSEFVLKATHDSSGAVVCHDKSRFNLSQIVDKYRRILKRNYFYSCREYPYKNIKPRIIAEALLKSDQANEPLRDYKFLCFNGVPKLMYCTVKGGEVYENFYDMDFKPVDVSRGFPRHSPEFSEPLTFALMKELAKKLANGIPFVRIDFYEVKGKVYFGEYTFYDWAGFRPFTDRSCDYKLGQWINLST